MLEPARIISEPLEVDAELHAFGLERKGLLEVLDAARWGRENTTAYDPPGFAGWNQYGIGTRSLRLLLIEEREDEKWLMCNKGGLCRTISPDQRIAIVVSSGSDATGNPEREPTTLNPKGKHTLEGLWVNTSQLSLFGDDVDAEAATLPWLWFLLINVRDGDVFGELSLPLDVDRHGRASEWLRRIMLPPVSLDDGPGGGEGEDDIDIDVPRRVG